MEYLLKMYRQFIKSYVSNSKLRELNNNAPDGKKWCNFLCQKYLDISYFYTDDTRVRNLCINCDKKNLKCKRLIKAGKITKDQFKENPTIINITKEFTSLSDVIIECNVCIQEKPQNEFEHNRATCKKCRREQFLERTQKNLDQIICNIDQNENNLPYLEEYLKTIAVNQLHKISQHYDITRNKTDKKNDTIIKIIRYFRQIQNPLKCLGNCGFTLTSEFSYCKDCEVQPKSSKIEENLKFKENLPVFMETLEKILEEEQYKYNTYCVHEMAKYFGITISKEHGKTKEHYIAKINEKLEERQKTREKESQPAQLELAGVIVTTRDDGFINATQLCKAGKKKFNDWYRLESTKELIKVLSKSETRIPVSQLITVLKGNSSKFEQGSWIHPDLAVQLAQWISPIFAIQVSRWIRELAITGEVTLKKQKVTTN